jgi:hypothetical protein
MAKPSRPWIVTEHGAIEKLSDNLWVVDGAVPGVPFRRRMSIVKRSDGSLLFFNAMPLEPAALEEVRGWGKPEVLVVPHDQHMIDADAFAKKLELKVYGPKQCEAKLRAHGDGRHARGASAGLGRESGVGARSQEWRACAVGDERGRANQPARLGCAHEQ